MKKFILFSILLASFFPFVSACGISGHEEEAVNSGLINFGLITEGFSGFLIQILIITILMLLISLLIKKLKGGK